MLASAIQNRVSSESHECSHSNGRVAFEVDEIIVSRLDRRSKLKIEGALRQLRIIYNGYRLLNLAKQKACFMSRLFACLDASHARGGSQYCDSCSYDACYQLEDSPPRFFTFHILLMVIGYWLLK